MGGRLWLESVAGEGSTFHVSVRVCPAAAPVARVAVPLEAAPPAAPRALRVLVAEDNRVNQLVISRLLDKQGHHVTLCSDGRQALAALDIQEFDLVLMDVQMPEMDGFAATAEIRRREAQRPGCRRLPIVALTAFAMNGDRDRCLAAGMDDYLSKPINGEQLAASLTRLFGAAAGPAAEPALDVAAALEYMGGDRELLGELLAIFKEDAPGYLQALGHAVDRSDPAALMTAAHALKGSLHVLGVKAAAALAADLEQLGRSGGLEGASHLLARLESEVVRVLAVVSV
jgi:CheY-like chemotaxis protein